MIRFICKDWQQISAEGDSIVTYHTKYFYNKDLEDWISNHDSFVGIEIDPKINWSDVKEAEYQIHD